MLGKGRNAGLGARAAPKIGSTETVLQLLRQLLPRERLRLVAQVLPELERGLSPVLASDFGHGADIRALAEQEGVQPLDNFDALLGGWPKDEPIFRKNQ